ncbi:hypothetical protein SNEBB_003505, partial [Seison nebaliae]
MKNNGQNDIRQMIHNEVDEDFNYDIKDQEITTMST